MNKSQGIFVTLEGGDGSGKTTVIDRLKTYLENRPIPHIITREPGGIEIAEKIREIILNPSHTAMDARTEALLYAASRSQHLAERVEPALAEGKLVLCDRFVDSSLVYQGYARGIGVDQVWSINQFAIHDRMPQLTFYLDIEPEIGMARIAASKEREVNRLDLEGLPFHHKVREGYMKLVERFPDRIVVIDASQTIENVERDIIRSLEERILKDF
ncbi:dTMP kinase [Paenibacillus azoreducens]|uniref:Thymidylate kinase n=1 Tax=Paenibacillus azoreducens TaxID=116718 RepID=A0A920CVT8_9BACL|nr:dTMP kinase [Paenibacillus azoreducens]GIO50832.1 thymidylate kinase [Paenibacillus azoreducens]